MKIRDIITEAEERNLDQDLERYFKDKERKQQKAEKFKKFADRPGIIGRTVQGIQRGNRWYKKSRELITGKKYYD